MLAGVVVIVSSLTVYPLGLVTPVVGVTGPVTVAPVVFVVLAVVVYVLFAELDVDPPAVVMLGVDFPPIRPKTPNPNNKPNINANKANIPNNGHNQLGQPPFFVFFFVSTAGAIAGLVTF